MYWWFLFAWWCTFLRAYRRTTHSHTVSFHFTGLHHFQRSNVLVDVLFEQFGFTPDRIVAAAHAALDRAGIIQGSTTGN